MKEEGTVPVTARLTYGTLVNLRDLLNQERKRRIALAAESRWSTERLSRRLATEVRWAWRQRLTAIRREGELLDTLDALVTFGVRQELRERGWDHPWPAYPSRARNAGRWPGSKEGGYPEKLTFRIPAGLESQVRAACWHTSARAIYELQDWQDRYRLMLSKRQWAPASLEPALDVYDRLAAKVTTTGAIWRGGVRRGIEAAARLCATAPRPA
ncbi:hypothetical protein AV521_38235 [Streptomyces sp. IMTB 2501]|nr:hypothetical protein AV521_38235 [Streptomyces sp. IMTB 2501]